MEGIKLTVTSKTVTADSIELTLNGNDIMVLIKADESYSYRLDLSIGSELWLVNGPTSWTA